jgi:membrane protease YdiL (CAAX protease family)
VPVTLGVLAVSLAQMWVVVPLLGSLRWTSALAILGMAALCVWGNRRAGSHWGFERQAMLPALSWVAAATLPAVALLVGLGMQLGTLQPRATMPALLARFALLLAWALLQQFMLQTVILREARSVLGRPAARLLAAALFAAVHLPNPFLTPVTFLAALGWCWIYDRHPNLLPLALSHACASLAAVVALGPGITGGMRVGYGYFLQHGIWL